jgi:hypothetical protein
MPNAIPIIVHVTANGLPVAGMSVSSPTSLQSSSTELVAANGANPAVNASFQFTPGSAITDANGDALVIVYPTSGQTFTINASGTFNNVSLTGSMTNVPADGQSHSIAFTIPGTLDYTGEYANAPYLTSLAVRNAANSSPIGFQPTFTSLNSVYTAASVEPGTTSVAIDTTASDPGATILTYGDSNLVTGTNLVTVQIADPQSGSARAYTIAVYVPASVPTTSSAPTTSSSSIPSSSSTSIPSSSTTLAGGVGSSSSTTVVGGSAVSESLLRSLPNQQFAPSSLRQGDGFTASIGGFVPGDIVELFVASSPTLLGTGVVDGNGVITIDAVIPVSIETGEHTLGLLASDGVSGVSQSLTVTQSGNSGLPSTGTDTRLLIFFAIALLGIGALGAFASRRTSRISD